MKSARLKTIITTLAITAVLSVGAESSHAQRFSFGGKSFGRSSSGGSKSSSSGQTSQRNSSSGQSSSRFSTTKAPQQKQSVFGTQRFNTKGVRSLPTTRGQSTSKPTSQIDQFKGKVGHFNRGTSTTNKNKLWNDIKNRADTKQPNRSKNPRDLTGKVDLRDIRNQLNDRFGGSKSPAGLSQDKSHGSKLESLLKGDFKSMQHRIKQNRQHNKVCVDQHNWCHAKPKHCHWWYNWCKPIRYCDPTHYVRCGWDYVTCDFVSGGHVVTDARWYLGMKGLLLPGQGIGIEEVAPGSPAAHVGLQPGMVITRCNGIDLFDEAALGDAIAQSGGVLQMDLLLNANGPPATCVVVMQRVASLNY